MEFVTIPHQILRQNFRQMQKSIHQQLETAKEDPQSLCTLQQHLQQLIRQQKHLIQKIQERIQELQNQPTLPIQQQIHEYLLQQRYFHTNNIYLQETQYPETYLNTTLHLEFHRIWTDIIQQQRVELALEWLQQHSSRLKRLAPSNGISPAVSFELQLHFQKVIQLIQQQQTAKAIEYVQTASSPLLMQLQSQSKNTSEEIAILEDYKQLMMVLACPPLATLPLYEGLFDSKRWDALGGRFYQLSFQAYGIRSPSSLVLYLQLGLCVMKTQQCAYPAADDYTLDDLSTQDRKCPVCTKEGLVLSSGLPYAAHQQSTLICNYTSKRIDDRNPPMALPNGYVYSEEAIEDLVELEMDEDYSQPDTSCDGNGRLLPRHRIVRCPRTGEKFRYEQIRPVFLL